MLRGGGTRFTQTSHLEIGLKCLKRKSPKITKGLDNIVLFSTSMSVTTVGTLAGFPPVFPLPPLALWAPRSQTGHSFRVTAQIHIFAKPN